MSNVVQGSGLEDRSLLHQHMMEHKTPTYSEDWMRKEALFYTFNDTRPLISLL